MLSSEFPDMDMEARGDQYSHLKRSIDVVLATMFLSSIGFTISLPSLWLYYNGFPECLCTDGPDPGMALPHQTVRGAASISVLMLPLRANDSAVNTSTAGLANWEEVWRDYGVTPARASCKEDDSPVKTCEKKRQCERYSGIIVAAFPFAQLIFSPLLGLWGTHRPVKEVLVFSLLVMLSGYSLYSMATSGQVLTLSRFLMGIGASNASVLRFYASGATPDHERTKIMAWISGAQALGYVVGPAIGYVLAAILRSRSYQIIPGYSFLLLNQYTSPGYSAAAFTLLNILAILVGMKELPPEQSELQAHSPMGNFSVVRSRDLRVPGMQQRAVWVPESRIDWRPTSVLILFFMVIQMVFSIYEGVGTQVSQCALSWGVEQNGFFLASMAVLSVLVVIVLGRQETTGRLSELNLMVWSYSLLMVALIVLMDFVPPLTLAQWICGGVLLSASFPVSQAMVWVLFSRVVPRRVQGLLMGYLISAGSFARMFGPPVATWAYSAGVMAFPLVLCVVYWELLRQQNTPATPAPTPYGQSFEGDLASDTDDEGAPLLQDSASAQQAESSRQGALPRLPSHPRQPPPPVPDTA